MPRKSINKNIEIGHGEDLQKEHISVVKKDGTVKFTQHRFEPKEFLNQVTLIPTSRKILPKIIQQPVP